MAWELEQTDGTFVPTVDRRPRLAEPLPVRLIAVSDVRLPTSAEDLEKLDEFYVELWGFQRDTVERALLYADNCSLRLEVRHGLVHREDFRPLVMEVPSIDDAEKKLIDQGHEFVRQHYLSRATASLVLKDPAGNWVEVVERRIVP